MLVVVARYTFMYPLFLQDNKDTQKTATIKSADRPNFKELFFLLHNFVINLNIFY